jgi:bifunctional DNase/RNase
MLGPDQALLVLADEPEERAVPIAVGRDQGIAIYLGREERQTPRPMTHDLLVSMLRALDAGIERVTMTELRENTYYAEILLRRDGQEHRIDARPSDAIALAVRMDVPIFVAPDLLRPLGDSEGTPAVVSDYGRHLGLTVQELERDLAAFLGAEEVTGVLVASVAAGGPAALAGLRRGDILRSIDGRPTGSLSAYRAALESIEEVSRFAIWREGKRLTLVTR